VGGIAAGAANIAANATADPTTNQLHLAFYAVETFIAPGKGRRARVRGEHRAARARREPRGCAGHAKASRGTGPVWGMFAATVTIPAGVAGQVSIEVFSLSPRDGSEQDVIRIPVTLH